MPPKQLRLDAGKYGVLRAGQEHMLRDVVARCAKAPYYGFDTETNGLDLVGHDRSAPVRTCGYCFSWEFGKGIYVPFGHQDGLNGLYDDQMPLGVVLEIVAPLLQGDLGGVMVNHHSEFEFRMCKKDGLTIAPDHDTATMAKVVSWATGRWDPKGADHGEGSPRSLKSLTRELLGIEVVEITDLFAPPTDGKKKRIIDFSSLPPFDPRVSKYAGADPSNTIGCYPRLVEILKQYDLTNIYEIERRLNVPVAEMKHVGVVIDRDFCTAKAQEGRSVAAELKRRYMVEISNVLGRTVDVNLDSPKQLGSLLFDDPPVGLGLPVLRRTAKTGAPSTDKETLNALAVQFPAVRQMLVYRGLTKQVGTYLEGMPKHIHLSTGRVHPEFGALKTETGRFACSAPNVQNMTRTGLQFSLWDDKVYVANVRDAVVATPEFYFLDFDYSQIEYRAMAGEAQERSLIAAFDRGDDVHAATAALITGKPLAEITPKERQDGKHMNFAILYGRGAENVSHDLNMTLQEAQDFLNMYFDKLPAILRWSDRVKEDARRAGYVTTLFGRRRRLMEYESGHSALMRRGDRLAVNTKIQGVCADILKMAMVRFHARCKKAGMAHLIRLVMTVHDSLLFEVHESVPVKQAYDLIHEAMVLEVANWPAIKVDCKIGYRYGSLITYPPKEGELVMPSRDMLTAPPVDVDDITSEEDDDLAGPEVPQDAVAESAVSAIRIDTPEFTEEQLVGLLSLLSHHPGRTPVVLMVGGERYPVAQGTSLKAEAYEWISVLGQVRVTWDTDPEDVLAGVSYG